MLDNFDDPVAPNRITVQKKCMFLFYLRIKPLLFFEGSTSVRYRYNIARFYYSRAENIRHVVCYFIRQTNYAKKKIATKTLSRETF